MHHKMISGSKGRSTKSHTMFKMLSSRARVVQIALVLVAASLRSPALPVALAARSSRMIYAMDRLVQQHSIESIGRTNVSLDQHLAPQQLQLESPQERQLPQRTSSRQHSVESTGRSNILFSLELPAAVASAVASDPHPALAPTPWTKDTAEHWCGRSADRSVI